MHLVEASRFVRIRPFRLSYDPFRHFFPWLFRHLAGPEPIEPQEGGERGEKNGKENDSAFALSSPGSKANEA